MLGTFLWALPQLLQRLDPVIFYPVVRAATFAVGYLFLHDWRRQEQAQIPAGPSLQIAAFLGSLMCPSFPRYVFLPFMASLVPLTAKRPPCRRHRFDPWVRKSPWRKK